MQTLVEVVAEFEPAKDYGIEIRKQYRMCLSIMKKGQKINPNEFIKNNLNRFTHGTKPFKTNREAVYHALWIGKKIGILKSLPQEESGVYISFDDFCNLDSVSYFIDQLRENRYRNVIPGKGVGTRDAYGYRLWKFDIWLHGKTFPFKINEGVCKELIYLYICKLMYLYLKVFVEHYKKINKNFTSTKYDTLIQELHNCSNDLWFIDNNPTKFDISDSDRRKRLRSMTVKDGSTSVDVLYYENPMERLELMRRPAY